MSKIPNTICDKCGFRFNPLDPENPVFGFQMKNGDFISLCRDCICLLGAANEEEKKEFFKDLGIDTDKVLW